MIKRVEQNVYRICKECTPFLLLVFYHEIEAKMRLKVMAHPQAGQESLEQRYYYYKDFQFQEMPDLIRYNFTNLWQIFEEIQITSRNNFKFDPLAGLRIALQIGAKMKFCLFQLQPMEHTYLETIEMLLWQAQNDAEKQQAPEQLFFHEIRQLRAVNQRHTQEIAKLQEMLKTEREERLSAYELFRSQAEIMQAEIYELRMQNEATPEDQAESQLIQMHNRTEKSSLICQQRRPVTFINLDDDSNWLQKIEQRNGISGLARFKFRLDPNSSKDIEYSFDRIHQRVTCRRKDETQRQFTSLVCLTQPIGLVSFRLIHTKSHNIYVGVVLPERINVLATTREMDAVSYKLSGSGLWEDNVKSKEPVQKIGINQILTLFIDRRRKVMQWWKFGRLIVQRVIPHSFQIHPAHPFINMIHKNDCVEFV